MSNLFCDFCNTRKEKLYKCGYKADRKMIKIYITLSAHSTEIKIIFNLKII